MTDTKIERVDAPREDLVRMTTTLRHEEEGNLLVGYAAVFNEWAVIDSWEGHFRERIAPGAFRKTLRDRGPQVKVLFNHGMDPSIGDKPLGKPREMREDDKGLYAEVPLDETSYNADIKALLRSGALDGMSFRMSVVRDDWNYPDDDLPERTITEIKLYEFGPVTFPAYEATQAGVRAHAPEAFEAWRSTHGGPAPESQPDPPTPPADPPEEPGTNPSEPAAEATRTEDDAPLEPEHPSQDTPTSRTSLRLLRVQRELTRDRLGLVLQNAERYDL